MKQIVDKLNKIAKKINENVELSDRDLIIDSLDSITKAYGGTPNDSTLIVDKLDDIYNNIGSAPSGNIEITENGENINVAPYATATVNVAGGGGDTYDIVAPQQTATSEYEEPCYFATITESPTSLFMSYYPSVILDYNGTTYTLAKDEEAGGYGDFVYNSDEDLYEPVFTNNPFALYVEPGISTFGNITVLSNNSFDGNIEIKAERVNPKLDLTLRLGSTGTCYVNYTDGDGATRTVVLHSNEADKVINVLNVGNNVIMAFEMTLGQDKQGKLSGSRIMLSHKAEANHVCSCTFSGAGENPFIQITFESGEN